MPMNKFDAAVHRTLVDFLIHSKRAELAAVMIDGEANAGYEWMTLATPLSSGTTSTFRRRRTRLLAPIRRPRTRSRL